MNWLCSLYVSLLLFFHRTLAVGFVPALTIIRIFPPPGTDASWDDISNVALRRDFLPILARSLA